MPVVPATGRLGEENHLNPGVGGCSEPRHATVLQPGNRERKEITTNYTFPRVDKNPKISQSRIIYVLITIPLL